MIAFLSSSSALISSTFCFLAAVVTAFEVVLAFIIFSACFSSAFIFSFTSFCVRGSAAFLTEVFVTVGLTGEPVNALAVTIAEGI